MRMALGLSLWAAVLVVNLSASSTILIEYQVNRLGIDLPEGSVYRYTYFISGSTLKALQELDIRFDPALYADLSNEVGGTSDGFSLKVLQPDNPDGTFGDYSLLALGDDPPWEGPFGVSFTFLGGGAPGAQPFFINQFDTNGELVATLESGSTAARLPEPGGFALASIALLLGAVFHVVSSCGKRLWTLAQSRNGKGVVAGAVTEAKTS